MKQFDIAIVGAGLAGKLAALALADIGLSIALIAPAERPADGRTTALMDQSIGFLRDIGVGNAVLRDAAPLQTMRIVDGTSRLLRAPPVAFHAGEVGLECFGYNIPNAPFLAALDAQIAETGTIERREAGVTGASFTDDNVTLDLDKGETIAARLVVGADGRKSLVRDSAGISVHTWSYPQTALVFNFRHELPHGNISTEFHTESGPFTQVPLPGQRSSLVWVLSPSDAEKKKDLPLTDLAHAVEARMQSMLGKVEIEGVPQAFPLSGMTAERFGKGRVVLVGEAAHAFPPIGAQGLNLSLRDILALRELVAATGPDATLGDRFDRKRKADIRSRTLSVDLLNRSLLSDFLPVQFLRAAGLQLLSSLGPLRGLVMREGIEPGGAFKAIRETLRERVARNEA